MLTPSDPVFPQIAAAQMRWVKYYRRFQSLGFNHTEARRLSYRKLRAELGLLPEATQTRIVRCVENME